MCEIRPGFDDSELSEGKSTLNQTKRVGFVCWIFRFGGIVGDVGIRVGTGLPGERLPTSRGFQCPTSS